MIIWLIIAVLAVAADQLTKLAVAASMEVGQNIDLIPGIIRLTYVRNEGAAFGMLANHRWVFIVISTVAIVAIIVFALKYRPKSKWLMCALTLVTAGGIGNMIDRIRLKYVIDMVDFYAFGSLWRWVFNVADACVCVGAFMILIYLVIDTYNDYKNGKKENKSE